MNKTTTGFAALIAATALLLTSCASTPNEVTPNSSEPADAIQTPVKTEAPITSLEDKIQEGGEVTFLTVNNVLGPDTFELSAEGMTGTAIVSLNDGFIAPAEGECGFEEAKAYATEYFSDGKAATRAHTVNGNFGHDDYVPDAISEGFITLNEPENSYYANPAAIAQASNLGLWALCGGFNQ